MSSEIYAQWRIQNLEVINNRLKQQLEAERRRQAEQLQQIVGAVQSIRSSISSARESAKFAGKAAVRKERISNISDIETEDVTATGFDEGIVSHLKVKGVKNAGTRNLEVMDWSGRLDCTESENSPGARKTAYAQMIENQISAAFLTSSEDIESCNSFVAYMNTLLEDEELDFAYFKSLVDRRFSSLNEKIELPAPGEMDESRVTYCALCELTGTQPRNLKKEERELEIERLYTQLREKEKEEYVYRNLREVLNELNMTIEDEIELDGLRGRKVVDGGIADCSVFMSMDGDGIIFETVAEVDSGGALSGDQKARIEESAHSICRKHAEVIRRMEQRGITLHIECEEKPKAQRIRKVSRETWRRRSGQRSKELHMGG